MKGHLPNPLLGAAGKFLEAIFSDFGPSWASSWGQVGAKLASKIDPKTDPNIDQNFDVLQDRFLDAFWWILGGKTEPSWHPNRTKNRYQLQKAIFQKNLEKPMKNQQFWGPEVSKLGRKFNQKSIKNGSENDMHLGIDF